jgi:hypothetical protein
MLFLFVIIVVIFAMPVVLGLIGAAVLLFIRPLRFLATYAAVVPIAGSCGAWLMSWGLAFYLEKSQQYSITGWMFLAGYGIGALLGSGLGFVCAFGLNRLGHHLTTRQPTASR